MSVLAVGMAADVRAMARQLSCRVRSSIGVRRRFYDGVMSVFHPSQKKEKNKKRKRVTHGMGVFHRCGRSDTRAGG